MSLYLQTPSGNVTLDDSLTEEEIALEVMACLINDQDPWVRLVSSNLSEWLSQWTVMERDSEGIPVKIASTEFDGETQVIDNPYKEGIHTW